jgi:hypothetical protein
VREHIGEREAQPDGGGLVGGEIGKDAILCEATQVLEWHVERSVENIDLKCNVDDVFEVLN